MFHSIPESWRNCLTDPVDLKELTPEWFYLPEFLVNCNDCDFGVRQNGVHVGDVVLPAWAASPEDFIAKNYAVPISLSYVLDVRLRLFFCCCRLLRASMYLSIFIIGSI